MEMPIWSIIIIAFSIAIVLIVAIIQAAKNNKRLNTNFNVGENNFNFRMSRDDSQEQSENNIPSAQQSIETINSQYKIDNMIDDMDNLKKYIINFLSNHILINTAFSVITSKEDPRSEITWKISVEIDRKRQDANNANNDQTTNRNYVKNKYIRNMDITERIIKRLYKLYALEFKTVVNRIIESLKADYLNIDGIFDILDKTADDLDNNIFINRVIQNFINNGTKFETFDGEICSFVGESINKEILSVFKKVISKANIDLVRDFRQAKTRVMYINKISYKMYSIMYCINAIFDSILNHIYMVYFENIPEIIDRCRKIDYP